MAVGTADVQSMSTPTVLDAMELAALPWCPARGSRGLLLPGCMALERTSSGGDGSGGVTTTSGGVWTLRGLPLGLLFRVAGRRSSSIAVPQRQSVGSSLSLERERERERSRAAEFDGAAERGLVRRVVLRLRPRLRLRVRLLEGVIGIHFPLRAAFTGGGVRGARGSILFFGKEWPRLWRSDN